MSSIKQALVASAFGAALSAGAFGAPTVLRASHQFPGGRGDVRDQTAEKQQALYVLRRRAEQQRPQRRIGAVQSGRASRGRQHR